MYLFHIYFLFMVNDCYTYGQLPLKLIFRSRNVSHFSKNSQTTHSAGGRYDKKQDDAM